MAIEQCEYCAVVLDHHLIHSTTPKYVLINYHVDGWIKREVCGVNGIEYVIADLNREGWQYAFKDQEDASDRLFFKRSVEKK